MPGTVSSPRRRAVASGAPAAGAPVTSSPRVPRSIRLAAHAAALTLVPSGLWRIAMALGWDSGFTDEHLNPANYPGPCPSTSSASACWPRRSACSPWA